MGKVKLKKTRLWHIALCIAGLGALVPLTGHAQDSLKHFKDLNLVACSPTAGCMSGSAAWLKRPANAGLLTGPDVLPLEGSPTRGSARPKVTLVEFADYTCPHTIKMEPIVRKLVNEYDATLRFVIKHHWLPEHQHARLAALVSIAADRQGKFWPVHEMLLDKHFAAGKDGATIDGFVPYLQTVPGLDVGKLKRDVNSPEVTARLDRELKEFRSTATPQFVLNGRFFEGELSEAQFELLIKEAAESSGQAR